MRDFTQDIYRQLVVALREAGYRFMTFEEYCTAAKKPERLVVLRHDVDLRARRSQEVAEIEAQEQAKASYYFRVIDESNRPEVIRRIAQLGHEIGYHYEDMSRTDGDADRAIRHFEGWLEYFRQFYPVRTICMHGAPTSRYDSKDLWKKYNYRDFGIVGEPYFDVDFSDMFYLTDTGRCWDGYKVSVRDKIPEWQDEWIRRGLVFHTTEDILRAIRENRLPKRLMITTHPQRWTNRWGAWLKEIALQSTKNLIKRGLILVRKTK